jgi:hypothetical protein
LFVAAQADLGYDLDLIIGEVVPGFSTHAQQGVLKASCISCSKQLFGIRCTSAAT